MIGQTGSVDRIEEETAVIVLDNGVIIHVKGVDLKEGDRIEINREGIIQKVCNKYEKDKAFALQNLVFRRGGNLH